LARREEVAVENIRMDEENTPSIFNSAELEKFSI
jgi:hypothetical protein